MAVERGVDEDGPVRVPVRIDEPGRDDPPVDVDDALDLGRIDRAEVADGQDPVAEHADIGWPRWRARCRRRAGPPRRTRSKAVIAPMMTIGRLARNATVAHLSFERPAQRSPPGPTEGAMTVEALRRRRPETLAELLEAYGRELQSVAYLILRDRSEAEDVVDRDAPDGVREGLDHPRRAAAARLAPARSRPITRSASGADPAASSTSTTCRTSRASRTSARAAPIAVALLHGLADCRPRCVPRSSCATTPTCRSTRSRRPSARAPTPSRRSSRPRSTGCASPSPSPIGASLGEAHHA